MTIQEAQKAAELLNKWEDAQRLIECLELHKDDKEVEVAGILLNTHGFPVIQMAITHLCNVQWAIEQEMQGL